jgi:hypothetical protein
MAKAMVLSLSLCSFLKVLINNKTLEKVSLSQIRLQKPKGPEQKECLWLGLGEDSGLNIISPGYLSAVH